MGLKNNTAFAVWKRHSPGNDALIEVFAYREDAEAHLRYLEERWDLRDLYIHELVIQYGQVT